MGLVRRNLDNESSSVCDKVEELYSSPTLRNESLSFGELITTNASTKFSFAIMVLSFAHVLVTCVSFVICAQKYEEIRIRSTTGVIFAGIGVVLANYGGPFSIIVGQNQISCFVYILATYTFVVMCGAPILVTLVSFYNKVVWSNELSRLSRTVAGHTGLRENEYENQDENEVADKDEDEDANGDGNERLKLSDDSRSGSMEVVEVKGGVKDQNQGQSQEDNEIDRKPDYARLIRLKLRSSKAFERLLLIICVAPCFILLPVRIGTTDFLQPQHACTGCRLDIGFDTPAVFSIVAVDMVVGMIVVWRVRYFKDSFGLVLRAKQAILYGGIPSFVAYGLDAVYPKLAKDTGFHPLWLGQIAVNVGLFFFASAPVLSACLTRRRLSMRHSINSNSNAHGINANFTAALAHADSDSDSNPNPNSISKSSPNPNPNPSTSPSTGDGNRRAQVGLRSGSVIGNRVHLLQKVLRNPELKAKFYEVMKHQFADDLLQFYEVTGTFEEGFFNRRPNTRYIHAKRIAQAFILPGSPIEINISAKTREEILRKLGLEFEEKEREFNKAFAHLKQLINRKAEQVRNSDRKPSYVVPWNADVESIKPDLFEKARSEVARLMADGPFLEFYRLHEAEILEMAEEDEEDNTFLGRLV